MQIPKIKPPCENTLAVLVLGFGMLLAEVVAIPASSHDLVLTISAGLVGYVAKAVTSGPGQP